MGGGNIISTSPLLSHGQQINLVEGAYSVAAPDGSKANLDSKHTRGHCLRPWTMHAASNPRTQMPSSYWIVTCPNAASVAKSVPIRYVVRPTCIVMLTILIAMCYDLRLAFEAEQDLRVAQDQGVSRTHALQANRQAAIHIARQWMA
jgi:hypothetical protein